MDFASLMSSQIAASKSTTAGGNDKPKYLKRSELEAQRAADYKREQEAAEKARLERLEKKRKRDEEEAERNEAREEKKRRLAEESKKRAEAEREAEEAERRRRLGLPPLVKEEEEKGSTGSGGEDAEIPDDELVQKLRELEEPTRLFGEDHAQRLRRYHNLVTKSATPTTTLSNTIIPTTLPLLPETDMAVPATLPTDPPALLHLQTQLASYFTLLLTAWRTALSQRPASVAQSLPGRQALASHTTALANLAPLYRHLERSTLPPTLLRSIHEIVRLAQQRRYVDANDAYLRLSIGKAAWPIGVTMVGIHERSAREKLHANEEGEAHILADEVTRKMLQGIKRCLSFAQVRWPPEDAGQIMG